MKDLINMTVLVTRPKPEGLILCEKIKEKGGIPVYLATIEFLPSEYASQPVTIADYDWVIFISPEAAKRGVHLLKAIGKKTRVASIGEGTANVLKAAGITEVIYPSTDWTSEGLLELPFFKELRHQKILLVKGEGGRELLAETLSLRGATVDHLPVYRRAVPSYSNINDYIKLLHQQKIDIIVSTSGESLHNLITILGNENQKRLNEIPIVVVSQRLAILAKELHFRQVFQAANASHDAMIDILCFIRGQGYVR